MKAVRELAWSVFAYGSMLLFGALLIWWAGWGSVPVVNFCRATFIC